MRQLNEKIRVTYDAIDARGFRLSSTRQLMNAEMDRLHGITSFCLVKIVIYSVYSDSTQVALRYRFNSRAH